MVWRRKGGGEGTKSRGGLCAFLDPYPAGGSRQASPEAHSTRRVVLPEVLARATRRESLSDVALSRLRCPRNEAVRGRLWSAARCPSGKIAAAIRRRGRPWHQYAGSSKDRRIERIAYASWPRRGLHQPTGGGVPISSRPRAPPLAPASVQLASARPSSNFVVVRVVRWPDVDRGFGGGLARRRCQYGRTVLVKSAGGHR